MINTLAGFRQDLLGPILQEGFKEDAYIAHRILPTLLVQKRNGVIPSFLYSNDQALQIKRAPKTSYARIVSKLGSVDYSCTESGLEEALSAEDYEVMGKDYAETLISRRLVQNVLRSRDIALAQAFFSVGGEAIFAQNLVTATAGWSAAGGTPLNDILEAKRNIVLQTGDSDGLCGLCSYQTYVNLCRNTQIQTLVRNVLGYSGEYAKIAANNEIPLGVLAQTFGLSEIIVGSATVNATNEAFTPAVAARSFVWSDNYFLVFKKAGSQQDVREVSLGRMFVYDLAQTIGSLATGSMDTMRALTLEWYRDEAVTSDIFRCREYTDMQVLLPAAGALIKGIA
jgi:hypothetical protein